MPDWTAIAAGSPLRPYQARAVKEALAALEEPGSRVCIVAPPGAGKTRCAFHVAAALQVPVEVRVPTSALVLQWQARVREELVDVAEGGAAPPVNVSTYAGMGAFADGALVVLDEAHHLVAAWGREVQDRLTPAHRVLGLTGTPPDGNSGWDRFIEIVGTEPVLVETPPLVRDGHLCPYQDLVWPVVADLDDVPALVAADRALAGPEHAFRTELDLWAARLLREDIEQLTEDRFVRQEGLLVALCRVRRASGNDLPNDLPADPDLVAPPTLHDRALVLWTFGRDRPEVKAAVEAAGFRTVGKNLAFRDDLGWDALASSHARLQGCIEVLAAEHRNRADGLRALILTDRDVEGDRLGARETLKALVRDPRTDPLDPVLVTGGAFWVDDDLWPRIRDRVPELPWTDAGDHHEVDVATWSVSERVALATRLLTDGVTHCLVGTRHLLGEGWDCPAVNCVVDLTGIVAAVTSNQSRGRGLRRDPADPSKVASLWDVVAVAPGVSGGETMLARLRERHAKTLGIDAARRIRTGVARIDHVLTEPIAALLADLPAFHARMARRAADVTTTANLWSVGQAYQDRHVWRLEGALKPPARDAGIKLEKPLQAAPTSLAALRFRSGWQGVALGVAGLVVGVGCAVFTMGIGILAALPFWAAAAWRLGRMPRESRRREAVLQVLFEALSEGDAAPGTLRVEGGRAWVEGPPEANRRFAEAAAELFGPVRYPRYLLVEPGGRAWPVPGALGAARGAADAFATRWAARIGACETVWARQGRGRDLLRSLWRQGRRGADLEVVEGWE